MLDTERKTNKIGGEYRSGNTDFQKGKDALKQKLDDKISNFDGHIRISDIEPKFDIS